MGCWSLFHIGRSNAICNMKWLNIGSFWKPFLMNMEYYGIWLIPRSVDSTPNSLWLVVSNHECCARKRILRSSIWARITTENMENMVVSNTSVWLLGMMIHKNQSFMGYIMIHVPHIRTYTFKVPRKNVKVPKQYGCIIYPIFLGTWRV